MRIHTLLLAAALLPFAAFAADLQNRDSQSYEVKIHDGGSTTHSSIGSNTIRTSICSACRIEVVGAGEIEVESGDTRVTIENGALSKE